MTQPREPRRAAPHLDDDRWTPREVARMKRRLLNKIIERWPPEQREAYLREREAERAAAKARRETP